MAFPVRHAAKSTLNARVGIHPNQRSMRVWHAAKSTQHAPNQRYECLMAFPVRHAAKSTLNARMACCQINAACACRHSAGLKTRQMPKSAFGVDSLPQESVFLS